MLRTSLLALPVALLALAVGCAENRTTAAATSTPTTKASTTAPAPKPAAAAPTRESIPTRAEDTRPLQQGARAPNATLRDLRGEKVDMADVYRAKPTVLIFYRGGWCPYCNTHLGQIAKVESQLVDLGYQVIAVSPDQPDMLKATQNKGKLQYQLLADSDMQLAKAFGLAFRLDAPTVTKYRGYGIDLEKSSGRDHHLLPVPAVYIIDRNAAIRFAHTNPDYRKRLDAGKLVQEARALAAN